MVLLLASFIIKYIISNKLNVIIFHGLMNYVYSCSIPQFSCIVMLLQIADETNERVPFHVQVSWVPTHRDRRVECLSKNDYCSTLLSILYCKERRLKTSWSSTCYNAPLTVNWEALPMLSNTPCLFTIYC